MICGAPASIAGYIALVAAVRVNSTIILLRFLAFDGAIAFGLG
jgi:hypothetical protein